MAAKDVDLPEPVAPTTKIKPLFAIITSLSDSGNFNWAKFGISAVMVRITIPTCNCC